MIKYSVSLCLRKFESQKGINDFISLKLKLCTVQKRLRYLIKRWFYLTSPRGSKVPSGSLKIQLARASDFERSSIMMMGLVFHLVYPVLIDLRSMVFGPCWPVLYVEVNCPSPCLLHSFLISDFKYLN